MGEPNVIRRIFIRGRSRLREIQGQKQRSEMELYTLKTEEGVTSQGMQASLEIGKGITIHSSLELLSKSPMSWLTDSS